MAGGTGQAVIGIDLGGTNMQLGVVRNGEITHRSRDKTNAAEGAEKVLARIAANVAALCAQAGVKASELGGVGIGAPGAIDFSRGVVLRAPNLKWTELPLADELSKRIGANVFVDNDVNVAALGEHRLGAGRGCRDLFAVWLGTGIGGGLVLDNRLYRGALHTAGEIGHIIALPDAPPGRRKLEHNASRTAITRRVVEGWAAEGSPILDELTSGGPPDVAKVHPGILLDAYKRGEAHTTEVIRSAAALLGLHIANYVTVLSIRRIVLGGGISETFGQTLCDLISQHAALWAFPDECKNVEVVTTQLRENAGLLGAALLATEQA